MEQTTLPPSAAGHPLDRDDGRVPGVVVVFSGGTPTARVMTLAHGPIELGRGDGSAHKLDDGRVSRRHARVAFEDGRWIVTDLGSMCGSFIDGALATAHAPTPVYRVLRIGDSLLVPYADVRSLERAGVRSVDGFVRGPAMQAVVEEAQRAARAGTTLHVRGETGSGKEGIVQAFHRASLRATRALVAVNCAAIPQTIAEPLLFGAKRGAYTGVESDATGYVQEADGGTLFLDELGELDLHVQAKLLRVLESKEVLPLGASKTKKVDFALCSATNKDLRALVAAGLLREDLYFRVATPAVTLPPLRDRTEEIPALITHELARQPQAPTAHVSLVEQCLLRPWPGNVRELLSEIRAAAQAALADGKRVAGHHLAATAGNVFGSAPTSAPAITTAPSSDVPPKRVSRGGVEWRKRIEDSLRASAGNNAAAARALGLHRTELRRLIKRHGIALDAPGRTDDPPDD